MTDLRAMLEASPRDSGGLPEHLLVECIEACTDCASICGLCADACLAEDMVVELRHCIRTNLDCADICSATAQVLSRPIGGDRNILRALLEACRTACGACGDECSNHASMHEHCRICAAACRRCEQACTALLAALDEG